MRFKKVRDAGFGLAALLFSIFYLVNAFQIKTRPKLTPGYASARIMPILLGVLLAILSIVCIINGLKTSGARMRRKHRTKRTKAMPWPWCLRS